MPVFYQRSEEIGRVPRRTWAEKVGAALSNAFAMWAKTAAKVKNHCTWSESIGRIRFRPHPMYVKANIEGTPPEPMTVVARSNPHADLIFDKSEVQPFCGTPCRDDRLDV